ncbi:tripartite motif-containing protein 2-like [Anneissia japonica]|uniref:tripartite motif-containing protein 2-like n=1 Tax=Anneissia japonica TaxID=1529436 RepID=UPI001425B6F9|nr:tripartite motif-containing protein 2-like [Anneissia japonica]
MSASQEEQNKCPTHYHNRLEFYCSTCKKSACNDCKDIIQCYKNKHDVSEWQTTLEEINQNAIEGLKIAEDITIKLEGTFNFILEGQNRFSNDLTLCRRTITNQEEKLIRTVREKSKALMSDLEMIANAKKQAHDIHVTDLDSKLEEVKELKATVNAIMRKPEEKETLESHLRKIDALKDNVLGPNFDKSFHKRNVSPHFLPSSHLDELMNTDGIGKITTTDSITYKVAEDDRAITVTKAEPFEVKVSSPTESDACQLAATLVSSSGRKITTEVLEDQESGRYKITGRCNVEGDWQMKITVGSAHIEGSPVNIKVERLGLVHTTGNISDYKEHNKSKKATGVMLDRDGYILVSSLSKDILKFNQSGLFVAGIQVPHDVKVNRIHKMGNGRMVYSDISEKCVVMCDDKFQTICSFGKNELEYPMGVTVNKENGVMYVADRNAKCVFKYRVDDRELLGKITCSRNIGQIKPHGITLTKEGHVVVADYENNRILLFDLLNIKIKILIYNGKEDGKVSAPDGVAIDMDENIIVSSNHKLQLFDKNGVFIKRIDHKDDGLDTPSEITVISKRPRRLAVVNNRPNNVKIYNY